MGFLDNFTLRAPEPTNIVDAASASDYRDWETEIHIVTGKHRDWETGILS